MNKTTYETIKKRLLEAEDGVQYPYLDNKGYVTIGVGFKIDTREDFLKLPLEKDKRPATKAEKSEAWDALMEEKAANAGKHNRSAGAYETTTSVIMPSGEIASRLRREIETRAADVERVVGRKAWNKLTDAQKSVLVDIHHANGSLKGYPKLVDAAKSGDAEEMARQSHFHSGTDEENGEPIRNWDRIRTNHCGALGKDTDSDACYASVYSHYRDKAKAENKPMETLPDEYPRRFDAWSKANQPQEGVEKVDPATVPMSMAPEKKAEADKFAAKMNAPADPVTEALVKRPGEMTEEDVDGLMQTMEYNTAGHPMRQAVADHVRGWFENRYGKGPVEYDATGRMKPQEPAVRLETAASANGLTDGLRALSTDMGRVAEAQGVPGAVKGLQGGLNLMPAAEKNNVPLAPALGGPLLKVDGDFGPKTHAAVKASVATFGAPKVREAVALASFGEAAKDAIRWDTLKKTVDDTFGPLFAHTSQPEKSNAWGSAFQGAVNDTGAARLGISFRPIKEDGWIGPKTIDAFRSAWNADGSGFLNRLGKGLGFFG